MGSTILVISSVEELRHSYIYIYETYPPQSAASIVARRFLGVSCWRAHTVVGDLRLVEWLFGRRRESRTGRSVAVVVVENLDRHSFDGRSWGRHAPVEVDDVGTAQRQFLLGRERVGPVVVENLGQHSFGWRRWERNAPPVDVDCRDLGRAKTSHGWFWFLDCCCARTRGQ